MKFLLSVKFNLFLIAANYAAGLWNFFVWCRYGTIHNVYVGIFNMVVAVIVALGLYIREGTRFDACAKGYR